MSRRLRRSLKAVASLVLLMLLAVACSSDGFPEAYDEQTVEVDGQELSLVQANWLKGCTVGLGEDLAAEANTICNCSYDAISDPDDGIPFEDFVELDNQLKGDPASLAESESLNDTEQAVLEIVKNCIASS